MRERRFGPRARREQGQPAPSWQSVPASAKPPCCPGAPHLLSKRALKGLKGTCPRRQRAQRPRASGQPTPREPRETRALFSPLYRRGNPGQRASRWAALASHPGHLAATPEIRAPDVWGPRASPYPQRIRPGSRAPLPGSQRSRPFPSPSPTPILYRAGCRRGHHRFDGLELSLAAASWRGAPGRPGSGGSGGSARDSSPSERSTLAGSLALAAVRLALGVPHFGPQAPPLEPPAGLGRGAELSQ